MTEQEAFAAFCRLRWPPDGEPTCPRCKSTGAYFLTTRSRFKCADCSHQFTPTNGTVFHGRKATFVQLMEAMALPERISSPKAALRLGMTQKAAFVLLAKMREARHHATGTAMPEAPSTSWRGYFQRLSNAS
jgi:hypothetical protein